MSSDEIGGIVRAIISALGGVAVARGFTDAATATAIGGALTTVIVAVWSVRAKRAASGLR